MEADQEFGVLIQVTKDGPYRGDPGPDPSRIVTGSHPLIVMAPNGSYFTVSVDGNVGGDPAEVERSIMATPPDNSQATKGALALVRLALRQARPN